VGYSTRKRTTDGDYWVVADSTPNSESFIEIQCDGPEEYRWFVSLYESDLRTMLKELSSVKQRVAYPT